MGQRRAHSGSLMKLVDSWLCSRSVGGEAAAGGAGTEGREKCTRAGASLVRGPAADSTLRVPLPSADRSWHVFPQTTLQF